MEGGEGFLAIPNIGELKMKVKELIELLQKADPEQKVRWESMSFSEYGECLENEGELDNEHVYVEKDGSVNIYVG